VSIGGGLRRTVLAMSADHRDLMITDLALSEAELLKRVASLEAEVAIYRELALQAIHALHDVTADRNRLRAQHHRLLDECRALSVQTRRQEAA
jgi:hypothetical protein